MADAAPATAPPAPGCAHCLAPLPAHGAVREAVEGAPRAFCCAGCLAAFRLIHGEGLERYYAERRWSEIGPAAPAALDVAAFQAQVRAAPEGAELDLSIDGIRCASCVWLNERLLARTPGVLAARVNYATHRARVRFDPARVELGAVLERIRIAGYTPRPWSDDRRRAAARAEVRDLLIRLGTAGFFVSQLMVYQAALYAGYFQGIDPGTRRLMEWIALGLTLPVVLYSGGPFLRAALRSLRGGAPGMDALVAVGSGAALLQSVHGMLRGGEVYFDTAAMIPTLVLTGRLVEAAARGRASEAVGRLAALQPTEARRVSRGDDGALVRTPVPVRELAAGDLVEVVPGERIPADGVVVEGRSEVDEALVTGEPAPVEKGPGAAVIGGTVNRFGALTIELTRVGDATVLAGIVRAVEEAQARKPRLQAVADRAVGIFVPALLVLAAATALGWAWAGAPAERALVIGISVVVIACPCALGLATPIAVLVATGRASARGILLRGGDALERAARLTDAVLDKTGTLTRGRPALVAVVPLDPALEPGAALALAAAAEAQSEHAVGAAIREAAGASGSEGDSHGGGAASAGSARVAGGEPSARGCRLDAFEAVPGRGVVARLAGVEVLVGNRALLADRGVALPRDGAARAAEREARGETVVFLARAGRAVALLAVADALRGEAAEAVAALRALRLAPRVLSGDAAPTTAAVAGALGLSSQAEVSPAGKREAIEALQRSGRRVLFAGDGLNDAPALGQADVGVAVGRVDIALESADVVLVRDDLRLLPELVRLARRATAVIRQNVFWAFFYNLVAIPLAMAGLLHPIVAAAAMAASSLFVVGNSMRLGRSSPRVDRTLPVAAAAPRAPP